MNLHYLSCFFWRIGYFIFLLPFALSGCKSSMPIVQSLSIDSLLVGPGPEDFVLDNLSTAEPRLIISLSERRDPKKSLNGFLSYNLNSKKTVPLIRINEPENFKCNPHGIDIVKGTDGQIYLYAVNHIKKNKNTIHSIVKYTLTHDSLIYVHNFTTPLFTSPNEVAALPNGSFYVSNDSKHTKGILMLWEKLFQIKSTTVVFKNEADSFDIAIKKLPFSNGLAIKNNTLYVACTFKNILNAYQGANQGNLLLEKQFKGVKGMDNITFYKNYLLIASHPQFGSFYKHAKNKQKHSPGIISLFNLEKDTLPYTLFANDGSLISANSTALVYQDTLYIGQVFDDFLLRVVLKDLP